MSSSKKPLQQITEDYGAENWHHRLWALLLVNGLTLSRLIAGIGATVAYFYRPLSFSLGLIFIYILVSDILDGKISRRLLVETRAGGIFDYVVDRFNFYLIICILIREGVMLVVFFPFLLRDLIYISVQAYINIPSIRGTKAASLGGTISGYLYVMVINYFGLRSRYLDAFLFVAFLLSLSNLLLRVYRIRHLLAEEMRKDLWD